jgi:hypothetical protein
MELAQLMILVGFIGSSSILFYTIINICLKLFGIHACEYSTNSDASKVVIITKYIEKTHIFSTSIHGDKPIGLVIGKWYIAYITTITIQKRDSVSIGYIVTVWSSHIGHTKSLSDDFIDLEKGMNIDNNHESLGIWRHLGAFKGDHYEKIECAFKNTFAYPEQDIVISKMKSMVQTSVEKNINRLVVMIAGPSGTGKSHIAKQFAKSMNATICDDFDLTGAGENFALLIKTVNPTRAKPLVVILDEHDKTIERIHAGIKEHEFFVIPVMDKASYNKFMDRLDDYDNVFVIITMNSTFDAIDNLDPSYTRCGRVDLKVNFGGGDSYNSTFGNFLKVEVSDNIAKNINAKRFTPQPLVCLTENGPGEIKKSV